MRPCRLGAAAACGLALNRDGACGLAGSGTWGVEEVRSAPVPLPGSARLARLVFWLHVGILQGAR